MTRTDRLIELAAWANFFIVGGTLTWITLSILPTWFVLGLVAALTLNGIMFAAVVLMR